MVHQRSQAGGGPGEPSDPSGRSAGRAAVRRERSFRGRPEDVHEVRSFVAAAAGEAGVDLFAATLAASELATNVVVHARTPFTVSVAVGPGCLRVELSDGSAMAPVARATDQDSASGRGVPIVQAVTDRWGSGRRATGKVVWFELGWPVGATG